MHLNKKISKAFVLSLVLASWGNGHKAEARIVTIIDDIQSALKINVISEPSRVPFCKKCPESPLRVKPKLLKNYEVSFYEITLALGFAARSRMIIKLTNLKYLKNYG